VYATRNNGLLSIQVRDNGVGMSEKAIAQVFKKDGREPSNTCIGLRNVNQRLVHIYGPAACLRIKSTNEEGTTVSINLPPAKKLGNPGRTSAPEASGFGAPAGSDEPSPYCPVSR